MCIYWLIGQVRVGRAWTFGRILGVVMVENNIKSALSSK